MVLCPYFFFFDRGIFYEGLKGLDNQPVAPQSTLGQFSGGPVHDNGPTEEDGWDDGQTLVEMLLFERDL
jgi:hypothetical protein